VLKRRYVYVLLFAVPALLVSVIAGAMMLAASAGALWLFVFGDNPWPAVANTLLGAVFVVGSGGLWLALLVVAYAVGKHQEMRPRLNAGHVALSVAVTILLAAVIVVRLMGLSMFGVRSNSMVCADFCQAQGFAGSGTPPENSGDRTCSCYDAQGREVRRVLLSEGTSGSP
jgi:hypothetical protein